MKVALECIAKLAIPGRCSFRKKTSFTLVDGQTVADLVGKAQLSLEDVETIIVNNTIAGADTVLADGDRVELVPGLDQG